MWGITYGEERNILINGVKIKLKSEKKLGWMDKLALQIHIKQVQDFLFNSAVY